MWRECLSQPCADWILQNPTRRCLCVEITSTVVQSVHALSFHIRAWIGLLSLLEKAGLCVLAFQSLFLFSASPFFLSVEGHLKEVIPIPLYYLSLLSKGLCGQHWSPAADQQSKSQHTNEEAEAKSSMHEIAAFYPPGVNSKIMPPYKAFGEAEI